MYGPALMCDMRSVCFAARSRRDSYRDGRDRDYRDSRGGRDSYSSRDRERDYRDRDYREVSDEGAWCELHAAGLTDFRSFLC